MVLASLVGTIRGGLDPPSSDSAHLLWEGSGSDCDGYWDSGLSIRAIAGAVIQ
ncbi:hypothetical protein AVEN_45978-1, partial [Araneus ventricosus]